jgi:hypothetical protein
MVEMACYGAVARDTMLMTNDYINTCPPLQKLFRVLMSAGDEQNQDNLKMAYWAMEIEQYNGGTKKNRLTFGRAINYGEHFTLLNNHMRAADSNNNTRQNSHDLYTTHIGFAPTCNNDDHVDLPQLHKRREVVTVAEHWYSMPQDWTRKKGPKNTFIFPTCTYKLHTGLSDVVGTLVGRTDGETIDCQKCFDRDGSCYQITQVKNPEKTLMPLFLEFDITPDLNMPAQRSIKIGHTQYILMAVVFHGNNHYKCNVLLDFQWYHYDGMGMTSIPHDTHKNYPKLARMSRIVRPHTFMTPPEDNSQFKPTSYRYMRKQMDSMSPQPIQTDTIPTDYQFNNMKRLMS